MVALREFLTALTAHRKWDFFRSNSPEFSINFCPHPFFEIIRKFKSTETFI